jgi:hypothetical protein
VLLSEPAIRGFLRLADPLDRAGGGIRAEPAWKDPIVLLPEAVEELLVGDRDAFPRQRVAPGNPVQLGRVDERAVEIPEDGAPRACAGRRVCRAAQRRTPNVNTVFDR